MTPEPKPVKWEQFLSPQPADESEKADATRLREAAPEMFEAIGNLHKLMLDQRGGITIFANAPVLQSLQAAFLALEKTWQKAGGKR